MSDTVHPAAFRKMQTAVAQMADLINKHYKPTLERLEAELANRNDGTRAPAPGATYIDSIPGVRVPRFYVAEVDHTYNETIQKTGSVEISPEGPFICTGVEMHYFYDDSDTSNIEAALNGRNVPLTLLTALNTSATYAVALSDTASNTIAKHAAALPEINFKIEEVGAGRFWTGQDEVTPAVLDPANGGGILAVPTWVDPSDRLQVYSIPKKAIPATGKHLTTFWGYQILNKVTRSQALRGEY